MIPFALALAMVAEVSKVEPLNQRMAPRSVALEIARIAETEIEAAVLTVVAWREGRLTPGAVGDNGKSLCVFQLQHAPRSVLTDLRQCTEIAAERIRSSAEACPDHPLSSYAAGSCSLAHEISNQRMAAAAQLLEVVLEASQPVASDLNS